MALHSKFAKYDITKLFEFRDQWTDLPASNDSSSRLLGPSFGVPMQSPKISYGDEISNFLIKNFLKLKNHQFRW